MHTVFSADHRFQHGRAELIDGQLHPPVEKPARADAIHEAVQAAGFGPVVDPAPVRRAALERVHTPAYLDFLATAWDEWARERGEWDALPLCWPCRTLVQREPETIDGRLGYYSFDAGTPITAGTWRAATASAGVAVTGAQHVLDGAPCAFSLCRPPGHHAAADLYGGYCFLNNAAIAAEHLIAGGCARVAILDVDYHHGNGTQAITYHRPDIVYASIHADPRDDFPFFLGYADETGAGAGAQANANYPLRVGTGWDDGYAAALDRACTRIAHAAPDVVVVSLGVDTFEGDPIAFFRIKQTEFPRIGARIAGIGRPVLFVMEGGYAVDALGQNVVNVLAGYLDA